MSADAARLAVLTLVAGLVLAGGPAAAAAAPADPAPSAAAAKKKRKAVRCKRNQVAVKVNRRTVACRSRAAALPLPKEGDARLLWAKSVLDDDLGGLRDRRGRRTPSLKRAFRKVGARAYNTVQRAIPEGLARLDGLAAPAKVSPFGRSLPKCGAAPPGSLPPAR